MGGAALSLFFCLSLHNFLAGELLALPCMGLRGGQEEEAESQGGSSFLWLQRGGAGGQSALHVCLCGSFGDILYGGETFSGSDSYCLEFFAEKVCIEDELTIFSLVYGKGWAMWKENFL